MRLVAAMLLLAACCNRDPDPVHHEVATPAPVEPAPPPVPRCAPAGRATCAGDDIVECRADGTPGTKLQTCPGGCRNGACKDTCAVHDAELIYVVDSANNLSSFDPRLLPGDPFHLVGKLTCESSTEPFSMAVDRSGVAWVLYTSGAVYRVSIIDAHCSRPVYSYDGDAPRTFGMGFVTDGPASTTEKLMVSADDDSRFLGELDATVDPPRWGRIHAITANQTRNPELTGTSEGRLYGYFPEDGLGFVREIDRATGKALGRRLPLRGKGGHVSAWAFAQWGGVFYVFATADDNSAIHAVHSKTGRYQLVMEHLPNRIVGAGVSTCAPLLEQVP